MTQYQRTVKPMKNRKLLIAVFTVLAVLLTALLGSRMLENHLLKFPGGHLVLLGHSLAREFLHGRESAAFRSVRDENQDDEGSGKSGNGSYNEACLPSQPRHNQGQEVIGNKFTDIRTRAEKTIVRASSGLREPARKTDHTRRRSHRLHPAVYAPQHSEHNEYQHSREHTVKQAEGTHQKIHHR